MTINKVLMSLLFGGALLMSATPARAKTLNVVTTTADLKSVVESIGGDAVKVYSLGKGNQNYHFLQAKPSYMVKAKRADLFVRNGLELEVGYESLILEGSRNPRIRVGREGHLDASTGIEPMDVHEHVDRSMGDIHASGNPHYWLDPLNMKIVAENIAERLIELSPEHQSAFEQNLAAFHRRIDRKMVEWKDALSPYRGEKLITYHESWTYFAHRFGLEIIGELEPKPGISPSPSHLKEIVDSVNEDHVKVILMENIYKKDAAEFVADKTGVNVVVTPISTGGSREAADYISLMDSIVGNIARGFRGE